MAQRNNLITAVNGGNPTVFHQYSSRFIDADTRLLRMVQNHSNQPVHPHAPDEMLIDNSRSEQPRSVNCRMA